MSNQNETGNTEETGRAQQMAAMQAAQQQQLATQVRVTSLQQAVNFFPDNAEQALDIARLFENYILGK